MTDLRERLCLFAIQKLFFQKPRLIRRLIGEARSVAELFAGDRTQWRGLFDDDKLSWDVFINFDVWDEITLEFETLRKRGINCIGFFDNNYPLLLRETHDPPAMLFAKGSRLDLLNRPQVAIVGSRKASEYGKNIAANIAEYLSGQGITVVSGMAYGVDAAAHRGALAGHAGTIAVFGCGIDIIYPASHENLARSIETEGLLLSEFPLGTTPYKSNFPQRNRIISGLSVATIIIEAALGSGSLITARLALEQGREVMACPGRAGDIQSQGVNQLIRDGAALVEKGEDVLEIVAKSFPHIVGSKNTGHSGLDMDKDTPLLRAMQGAKAMDVDQLVSETHLDAPSILVALTRHVIEGMVEELPGRRFRLKRP